MNLDVLIDINISCCDAFYTKDGQPCTIAKFGSEDLNSIISIEQTSSEFPWTRKNFSDSLSSSHICVGVLCGDTWVAHAVFSLAADEAELLILAVDKDFQGNRIAAYLLGQMEKVLGVFTKQLFLEVRRSNQIAIGLYESLGFNKLGERRNYYPLPGKKQCEDALIYGKYIEVQSDQ